VIWAALDALRTDEMDLILWRHADARDAEDGEDDLLRPLTPRGEKQARRMAEWLDRLLPSGTRVLVSPARRAQQTADALQRRMRTLDALAPQAGLSQLLTAARWPESPEPVLVVGHQPTLGQAAAWLMTGELPAHPWSIRKGSIWWLRRREREHGAEVVLVAVRTPDLM
jgi:phosphohistidine phosphatase